MHLPYWLRRVNRVFTNRILGRVAWLVPPLALVRHVGRRSGRDYASPVIGFGNADGFVIPMTYGRDVDWARNLMAAQRATVVQGGRTWRFEHVRVADGAVASPRLPPLVRPLLLRGRLPGYVLLDP